LKSSANARFWACYEQLPPHIQNLARKTFTSWQNNPRHPSLHFKEVKLGLWSARVGLHYRALGAFDGKTYVWFWIGTHDEYERLIAS